VNSPARPAGHGALARLAAEVRAEGGLLADTVVEPDGDAPHGATVATGPRADGRGEDYALLVEAIYEGYLQHYGTGRVLQPDEPDLALLAGDRLYALGLARLAELGDLEAVAELADVISLAAQAHAEESPERAAAAWVAGVAAVGHGGSPEHAAAKALARDGGSGATGALGSAARRAR
jgi:hypothetical protein